MEKSKNMALYKNMIDKKFIYITKKYAKFKNLISRYR